MLHELTADRSVGAGLGSASDAPDGTDAADPSPALGTDPSATARTESVAAGREEPSLVGCIEIMKPNRIAGWVMDRSHPGEAVGVACARNGTLLASTIADRPRKDLERASIGTGRHGFELSLDPPLAQDDLARCHVRATASDGTSTILLPRQPEPRAPAPPGDTATLLAEVARIHAALASLEQAVATAVAGQAARIEAIETVQARIEIATIRVEQALDRRLERGPATRGLRLMVAMLGVVALASVALGVASVVFGA